MENNMSFDSESLATELTERSVMSLLEIFFRVHRMLTSFIEALKFRESRCFEIDYDKIALIGALDVVATVLSSMIHENVAKAKPGLFHGVFLSAYERPKATNIPDIIFSKVEKILRCLAKSSNEELTAHLNDVSTVLKHLPSNLMPTRLRILCFLLKEATENMLNSCHLAKEPLNSEHVNKIQQLIENFVKELREKQSGLRPRFRTCTFCNRIITVPRPFCCKDSETLNRICQEGPGHEEPCNDRQRATTRITEYPEGNEVYARCAYESTKDPPKKSDPNKTHSSSRWNSQRPRIPGSKGNQSRKETRIPDGPVERVTDTEALRTPEKQAGVSRRNKPIGNEEANDERQGPKRSHFTNETPRDTAYRNRAGADKTSQGEVELELSRRKRRSRTLGESPRETLETVGKDEFHDREEKTRSSSGSKMKPWRNTGEMVSLGKESRKKKADAPDSGRKGVSYGADEEELKDEKREERFKINRRKADDADAPWKRTDDKSMFDTRNRKDGEENPSGKKGYKLPDSARTDDYSKTNGYQKRNLETSKLCDLDSNPPNPIEYQLSNEQFVRLGWTVLPVAKTRRRIVQYEATTAKPHLDCDTKRWLANLQRERDMFKKHGHEGKKYYRDGSTPFLAVCPNESREIFYPNGELAVRLYRPKERKYDMCTVFSPGGKDAWGIERKPQLIAAFDSTGNGIVLDENGEIRLSYNQIGGTCKDNPAGASFTWTWSSDTDQRIVETVYEEKSIAHLEKVLGVPNTSEKSSERTPASPSAGKEKKVGEQKPVVQERQETVESGPDCRRESLRGNALPMKAICMKLNEYVTLRILSQKDMYLKFFAASKSIKIELGIVLNRDKVVDSWFVDSSDWKSERLKCRFEDKLCSNLGPSSSLYDLSKEYQRVKKLSKQRQVLMEKYKPSWSVSNHRKSRCTRNVK